GSGGTAFLQGSLKELQRPPEAARRPAGLAQLGSPLRPAVSERRGGEMAGPSRPRLGFFCRVAADTSPGPPGGAGFQPASLPPDGGARQGRATISIFPALFLLKTGPPGDTPRGCGRPPPSLLSQPHS